MKKYIIPAAIALTMSLGSCSEAAIEGPQTNAPAAGATYTLEFDAPRPCWDDEAASRADHSWQVGDELYVRLGVSNSFSMAKATYNGSNWDLTYTNGSTSVLQEQGTAYVSFIDGYKSLDYTSLLRHQINNNSIVYNTNAAIYTYDGSTVKLYGILDCASSGLRLKGTAADIGKIIMLRYINAAGQYYPASLDFNSDNRDIYAVTMHDDGMGGSVSDYVYSMFWDREIELLRVEDEVAFKTSITAPTFGQLGKRGYITLPTADSHEGWEIGYSPTTTTCAADYSYGSKSYNAPSEGYDAVYEVSLSKFTQPEGAYNIELQVTTTDPNTTLVTLSNTDGKTHYVGEKWYIPVSSANNTFRPGVYNWFNVNKTGSVDYAFYIHLASFTNKVNYSATLPPEISMIAASCNAESIAGGYDYHFSALAYINTYGAEIEEAGFIYRYDSYALDLESNYNDNTVKIECDVNNRIISAEWNESSISPSYGNYVRAYVKMKDGSVYYHGDKIYLYDGYSYSK